MSKYIIDTGNYLFTTDGVLVIGFDCDNKPDTCYEPLSDLEELNSDYINEHYGELQDEAYQRGFEDGKKSIDKGCEGCRYASRTAIEEPCKYCSNCHTSKYTPMPVRDDRIEVGDEVKAAFGTAVVTHCDEEGSVWYLYSTGSTGFDEPRNVKKTGRHFDIASILEAMRE